ncbi:MAG: hypothetical protein E6J73_10025 [Deltaproteobacteria bacterium]|nr:MAG: hypothetical protein E6J73_10025 [Deltaproteobacteria bacterium]
MFGHPDILATSEPLAKATHKSSKSRNFFTVALSDMLCADLTRSRCRRFRILNLTRFLPMDLNAGQRGQSIQERKQPRQRMLKIPRMLTNRSSTMHLQNVYKDLARV